MEKIYLTPQVNNIKTAVAVGKFDAIHTGHISLIKKVADYAGEHNLKSVVYTVKAKCDCLISANEQERTDLIKQLGIDMLCTDMLTDEYSKQSPEEFVENVLIGRLNAQYVAVGYNFKFGHRRTGDAKMLKDLCDGYGIACEIIDCVCDKKQNIPISTTYIKELVRTGEVHKVSDFLGRHFSLTGEVCFGEKLGREIGFPTANLCCAPDSIMPKNGVYFTKVKGGFGEYYGITNIGTNPTVSDDNTLKAETHIIDFNGELYGKNITVEFLKRIRDEKKFSSLYELKSQLLTDLNTAKELLTLYI